MTAGHRAGPSWVTGWIGSSSAAGDCILLSSCCCLESLGSAFGRPTFTLWMTTERPLHAHADCPGHVEEGCTTGPPPRSRQTWVRRVRQSASHAIIKSDLGAREAAQAVGKGSGTSGDAWEPPEAPPWRIPAPFPHQPGVRELANLPVGPSREADWRARRGGRLRLQLATNPRGSFPLG